MGYWAEKAPGSAAASGEGEQVALSRGLCHQSPAQAEPGLSITAAPVSASSPPPATCSLTSAQLRNCVPACCWDGRGMMMGRGLSGSGQCLKGCMEPVGGTGVRLPPPTFVEKVPSNATEMNGSHWVLHHLITSIKFIFPSFCNCFIES